MDRAKVLITGGNGYIGSRFLQHIICDSSLKITSIVRSKVGTTESGLGVSTIFSDLKNITCYANELKEAEYIVWFAANRNHFGAYRKLYEDNVSSLEKALSVLCGSNNLKAFIYISSISAIDNHPYIGGTISSDSNPCPNTPYGRTKLLAEKNVRNSGVPFVTLRLPFMYGSGYREYSHLWFWKRLALSSMLKRIHYSGSLSLLHIDDLARMIKSYIAGEVKIGGGNEHILSDGEVHRVDNILDCIRTAYGLRTYRRTCDSSSALNIAIKLIPSDFFKYWSSALLHENYFVVTPTSDSALRDFRFAGLQEGLRETYSLKTPNECLQPTA